MRQCFFCKVKREYTTVKRSDGKGLSPICYSCNKKGVHLENKWEIKIDEHWIYRFMEDKFIRDDGFEISRLMYQQMLSSRTSLR